MSLNYFTAVYQEGELRKKYHNYFVPAAKILIGDDEKDLADDCGMQVLQIHVSLNLTDAASADFTVTGVYDDRAKSLQSMAVSALVPGNTVKIKMGYGSALTPVFFGYIYERAVQFGDVPSIQVTAMDVRHLMMDHERENYKWNAQKHSDLVAEILKEYGSLILEQEIETTTMPLPEPMVQCGNDLEMIRELCRTVNKEFLVHGGSVSFSDKKETRTLTPLVWGEDLISFSQTPCYVDYEIEVRGNLRGSGEKFVETRTVSCGGAMKHARQKKNKIVVTLTDIASVEELQKRADLEVRQRMEQAQAGSGTCLGNPVLLPGRCVEIKGLEETVDGDYYLESVSHSFGSDGFTTDFSAGRAGVNFYEELLENKRNKTEKSSKGGIGGGILLGRVTANWDSDHPGMVKVEILLGEDQKNEIGWAPVAVPYAGSKCGTYLLPEVGSYVLLAFHMGQQNSPYVIGCIWNQQNALPDETADEQNTKKGILTKGGNRFLISDEEGKEKITVTTKKGFSLELDDENEMICVSDSSGDNKMIVKAKEGSLIYSADKSMLFRVNGKELLKLDGESGKIGLQADQITAEAGQKLKLKGQNISMEGSSARVSGQNIKLEAQASLECKGTSSFQAQSSGIAQIKGSMIKLN